MNFTIYTANVTGNPGNCSYPNKHIVTDEASLKAAVCHDYVCAEYEGNYRNGENFLCSNCLAIDCDNDHTEDSAGWVTPEDVRKALPDVSFAVHYSRFNGREKNGKPPRQKFHVLFDIDTVSDPEEYSAMKRRVNELFPYCDSNAMDAARFFFGTKEAEVAVYPGNMNLTKYLKELEESMGDGVRSPESIFARKGTGSSALPTSSAMNNRFSRSDGIPLTEDIHSGHCIPSGQRNSTMYSYAVRILKRFGETEKAAELFFDESECCSPPLGAEELSSIWNSALKFYRKKVLPDPAYIPPEEFGNTFSGLSLKPPDYSDLGQAKVLVRECGEELCFTESTDYLCYDGKRWEESRQKALGCAEGFLDAQLADAEEEMDSAIQELTDLGEKRDAIIPSKKYTDKLIASNNQKIVEAGKRFVSAVRYREFVMQRRDMRFIKSALDAAKPMVQLKISDLDKDEFLLNTPDATYDLRQGLNGARQQDPDDHITKITAVSPSEKGRELWEQALQTFFCGDRDLIRYVQEIVGLAAIGKVYQEAIIIAYGDGKNGKSTFWNTVARVFGSYAGNMSADTLTVGCKRNTKPEMAELKGKRLVIASELEEGMRLNTSMVKQLCSTDEIYAEKKYKDPFSFVPSHTLVLYTNHLPRVGASDAGTWRRLIVIPFNALITGISEVKNYADHLFQEAGEYVLQWIIEGAQAVIQNDFDITLPKCVRDAIQAYRDNNDWFANFLDDCCEVDKSYTQKSGELYVEYRAHCARNGEYARSTSDFYTALELAGFERRKTNKANLIIGLKLKDDFEALS